VLKVLLASRNAGKLREFGELLPDVTLVPWPQGAPSLPETGAFFSISPSAIRETSRSRVSFHLRHLCLSIAGAR